MPYPWILRKSNPQLYGFLWGLRRKILYTCQKLNVSQANPAVKQIGESVLQYKVTMMTSFQLNSSQRYFIVKY